MNTYYIAVCQKQCSHAFSVDMQQTAPVLVIWSEGDLGQSFGISAD